MIVTEFMRDEREFLALAAIAQKKIPILRFVDTDAVAEELKRMVISR